MNVKWSWIPTVMAVRWVWTSLQICCCSAYLCTCQKSLFKCTWCLKSMIRSGCTIAPNSAETWSAWEKEISQCIKSGADNIPSENEADQIQFLKEMKISDLSQSSELYLGNLCLYWSILLVAIIKVCNLKWSLTFCPIVHSYFFNSTSLFSLIYENKADIELEHHFTSLPSVLQ